MSDTRKDKRAPVSLKVRFKSATVDEFMEQYARDISRGGLFIKSKSPMPIGTLLKFEVQLKDESPVIRGVGRVVWKREPGDVAGNDAPSGMGIKFIRMEPECRALVEQIVVQRGGAPGQFEAGEGDTEETAPQPASKSTRPRQVTAPFFPAAGPSEADMPLPEDRTQVRHASEFLASALAEAGDSEASREAERRAEEARRRSEEIDRERAARTRGTESERPKPRTADANATEAALPAGSSKRSDPPAKRSDPPLADREAKRSDPPLADREAKRSDPPQADREAKRSDPPAMRSDPPAMRSDPPAMRSDPPAMRSDPPKADREEIRRPEAESVKNEREPSKPVPIAAKAAEPAKPAPKTIVARDLANDRPPPVEESTSYVIPVVIGVAALIGIGYFAWSSNGGAELSSTTESASAPSELRDRARDEPAPTELAAEAVEDSLGEDDPLDEPAIAPSDTAERVEPAPEMPEMAAAEPAAPTPTVRFRVETTPPGATITVGDTARGVSPLEIETPVGTAVAISARLAGHRVSTQEITPGPTARPVRLALTPLPYVVEITTVPPEARVRVAGRVATAVGATSRVTVSRPAGPIPVIASQSGYLDASQTVRINAFTERDGEMVATLSLTLVPRPAAAAAPARAPSPRRQAPPAQTGGAPAAETAPTPATEAPSAPEPRAPATAEHTDESPRRSSPPASAEEEEAPPENPF